MSQRKLDISKSSCKLRIIGGKCVNLLYEEAERIDTANLFNKLSSIEEVDNTQLNLKIRKLQEQMQAELNDIQDKHDTLLNESRSQDKINEIDRKLDLANKHFKFTTPTPSRII